MSTPIYLSFTFIITPRDPATEILIAELGVAGFESFVENENGVTAYIQKPHWNTDILNDIYILTNNEFKITYTKKEIEQVNWNKEWEKNFNPITVEKTCSVRAPFHKKPDTKYDIIIEPKMSFGTGHHETTHMMIAHILTLNCENKTVLDMGCGTGILAILTAMKGAKKIDAIDIDNWCYINTKENIVRNNCSKINVLEGDANLLINKKYDIIIANINRNILLNDIPKYASCLTKNATLLLSGFYTEDIPIITKKCNEFGLKFVTNFKKNDWVALKFVN